MLVEDQDGQKMVVVNPGPGEEPQTIVIPEQVDALLILAQQSTCDAHCTVCFLDMTHLFSGRDCIRNCFEGK